MADNRKAAITAKVAAQCAEFYNKSMSFLDSSTATSAFGDSQVKVGPLGVVSSLLQCNTKLFHGQILEYLIAEMEETH